MALGAAFIVTIGIFSFVIGTIIPRISGFIAVIVYSLMWYLTFAFAPYVMYISSFVPNPHLIVYSARSYSGRAIPILPFWPTLVGTFLLIWIAGEILESEVDA